MMLFEYNSNNSGGSWWLTDENWKALEAAGWKCVGYDEKFIYVENEHAFDENGFPKTEKREKDDGMFGKTKTYGFKHFDSVKECLIEFEKLTGQNVSDNGCNCCGPPHNFSWKDEKGESNYCSGSDCLQYLFDNVPASLRDACS